VEKKRKNRLGGMVWFRHGAWADVARLPLRGKHQLAARRGGHLQGRLLTRNSQGTAKQSMLSKHALAGSSITSAATFCSSMLSSESDMLEIANWSEQCGKDSHNYYFFLI